MPATSWIAHVKATHKKLGGTYKAAMIAAKKTWKKKSGGKKKANQKGYCNIYLGSLFFKV